MGSCDYVIMVLNFSNQCSLLDKWPQEQFWLCLPNKCTH